MIYIYIYVNYLIDFLYVQTVLDNLCDSPTIYTFQIGIS